MRCNDFPSYGLDVPAIAEERKNMQSGQVSLLCCRSSKRPSIWKDSVDLKSGLRCPVESKSSNRLVDRRELTPSRSPTRVRPRQAAFRWTPASSGSETSWVLSHTGSNRVVDLRGAAGERAAGFESVSDPGS